MQTLRSYIKTLANLDHLIGCKVLDTRNDRELFINDRDGSLLWCGKTANSEFGNYYRIDDLNLIEEN